MSLFSPENSEQEILIDNRSQKPRTAAEASKEEELSVAKWTKVPDSPVWVSPLGYRYADLNTAYRNFKTYGNSL